MTKARRDISCPVAVIGLNLNEAARMVGFHPTFFETLVEDGIMPPPRRFKQRKIWSAKEVEEYFDRMPHDESSLKPGVARMHVDPAGAGDKWDEEPKA